MISIIAGALSLIGQGVKGFFGVKESQLDTMKKGLEILDNANVSSAQKEKAIATIISTEASSSSWLTRMWRPLVMTFFSILVGMYFFGYTPENMMVEMPQGSMIREVFEILKIGIMGYMPLRTVEKVVSTINLNKIIDKVLKK